MEFNSSDENRDSIIDLVTVLLQIIEGGREGGELRQGLVGTPERVARMYNELFSGYSQSVEDILAVQFNKESYDEIVVGRFPFYSTCEHHMLPFFGTVYVGYLPSKSVVGLSKLGRLVDVYARRLQLQERMTVQIADDLQKYLVPLGCGVIVEGRHLCMEMRGVNKVGGLFVTSALRDCFLTPEVRGEFMNIVSDLKRSS